MELISMIISLICVALMVGGAYLAGHTAAMHQHASIEEIDKLLKDGNGNISKKKYIKEAFKDYKRMLGDPYGFNRLVKQDPGDLGS